MFNPYSRVPTGGGTVPDTFAPDVREGEIPMTPASSGPYVAPMRNAAPGLLQQTGQTLTEAGNTMARLGNTIGDRVQDAFDEATTKQAETQFLQNAQNILYNPNSGFMHQLGQNAIAQYDGTKQALAKAATDTQNALPNPLQQRMFAAVAQQHLMNLGMQIDDHLFQQKTQYAMGAADARSAQQAGIAAAAGDSYGQLDAVTGQPTGQFNQARNTAIHETLTKAALMGLPADSPQAQQMVKDQNSQIMQGVIAHMADQQDYDGARQVLDKEKDEINENVYERLDAAVTDGHMSARGNDLAAEQKQVSMGGAAAGAHPMIQPVSGASVTSSPADGKNFASGVVYATPPKMPVKAAADGVVQNVVPDTNGSAVMTIRNADGSTMTVSGLSAFNYHAGEKVTAGQTIGLTGRAAPRTTGVTVSMTDANGQPADPRASSVVPKDPMNFTDPNMLAKAIEGVNATDEPQQVKDIAINRLKSDYGTATGVQKDQQNYAYQQGVNYSLQHKGSMAGFPAALQLQMRPDQWADLNQPPKTDDNVNAQLDFLLHPENQNVDWVMAHRADFKPATLVSYVKQAQDMQNNPGKALDVKVDNDQIKTSLLQNGFQSLVNSDSIKDPKAKDAAKDQLYQLVTNIRDQIAVEQQVANRPLAREQKQQIIDQTLTNKAYVYGGAGAPAPSLFLSTFSPLPQRGETPDQQLPLWQMTPQQMARAYVTVQGRTVNLASIPADQRSQAIAALQRRNMPVTEQSIADLWVRAGMPGGETVKAR